MRELDLTGRSLTTPEYMHACFAWLDDPLRREDDDLATAIADAEARRMIDRYLAGEAWEAIRAQSRHGRPPPADGEV